MRGVKETTHFLHVLTSGDVATISSAGHTWISLVIGVEPPKIFDLYSSGAPPLYPIFILFSVLRDIILGEAMLTKLLSVHHVE